MKNLHIEDSYKTWSKQKMQAKIMISCHDAYGSANIKQVLNRTYQGMYIEWWLHNIGYWITLPFTGIKFIKVLNERFKHVDLEEHIKKN